MRPGTRAPRGCQSPAASSRWSTSATAAEELGADGAYFRVHHFARQLSSPFPLLAACGVRTNRIDEAIAEADTLLLTVPNQLGVDYNAHVIEAILKHVAPGLGWR